MKRIITAVVVALAALAAGIASAGGPLTKSQIQPQMLDSRAYLDSYSFWVLGDDGSLLFASVLLSNLAGTPTRPGYSLAYYGADGQRFDVEGEVDAEALTISGPPLNVGFEPGGRLQATGTGYSLNLLGKDRQGVTVKAEMNFSGASPSHTWAEPMAVGDGRFWLGQLFPSGIAKGQLKVGSGENARVIPIEGQAYGDHSWQDAWAHHIARRWVNVRFFSDGPDLALTTWKTPEGLTFARGALVEGGELVSSIMGARVEVQEGGQDAASGYPLPSGLSIDAGSAGLLNVTFGAPVDRRDLLGGVTPVVKTLLQWFVAKPYSYRFKKAARLHLPGANGSEPRYIEGVVVAEIIYVNAP